MGLNPSTDFDVGALFTALDEQRRSRGLTWRAAAEEINALFHEASGALGISASTLTGMRTKSAIEGDGVLQILIWLDRTPESLFPTAFDTDGSPLPRVGPKRVETAFKVAVRPDQMLSAINGCGDPHTCTTLGDLAAFTRSSSFARATPSLGEAA